jgi:cation transport ATPase
MPVLQLRAFQTAPANEQMEKDFLSFAASLAPGATHPGAADILKVAHNAGCTKFPVIGFQDFPGRGFGGVVQIAGENRPRAVLFGTRAFLAESGLDMPAILEVAARKWEAEKADILLGGWDGYVRGLLKFAPQE